MCLTFTFFFSLLAHSSFFDSEKPDNDTNESKNLESDGSCPVLPSDTEAETVRPKRTCSLFSHFRSCAISLSVISLFISNALDD